MASPATIIEQVFAMSPDEQFVIAERVATNIGYRLIPDNADPDELTMSERIERLERAVRELNPGLSI